MERIGILETAAPDPERLALWEIFRRCLQELGHADGAGVVFEFRWAEGHTARLAPLAAELVGLGIDVLITAGTPAAAAASRATSSIPIVMATGVGLGTQLSDGAAPRQANVTGISDLPQGISEKRLQLLCDAVGGKAPLAFLADRGNPSSPLAVGETAKAAQSLDLTVKDHWIANAAQFGDALAAMVREDVKGFVVAPGALFFAHRKALATLAIEHGLASITARRDYAEAGCLMSYGAAIEDNYRQAADYVNRILGGAKPAELPIAEPTSFELVINRKTAGALGLKLPPALLASADAIG